MIPRNLILALIVTIGAVAASVLAVRRRARLREAIQHRTELQTWENEGGSIAGTSLPSRLPSEVADAG
jgi:hypothetical protein